MRYFITFLDHYTKWLEVKTLVYKNDVYKAFISYNRREENLSLSSKKIKTLRTDNGIEYFNISKY